MSDQPQQPDVPAGYRKDYKGNLVNEKNITPIDLARDELVNEIIATALPQRDQLAQFKKRMLGDIHAFLDMSLEEHQVKLAGKKGGVTLPSFDGKYKVVLRNHDFIGHNEKIYAAQELIDNCFKRWGADAKPELKAVIDKAFKTNSKNQLKIAEIQSLKSLKIDDEEWREAMKAIDESLTVNGSTWYINLYQRVGETERWQRCEVGVMSEATIRITEGSEEGKVKITVEFSDGVMDYDAPAHQLAVGLSSLMLENIVPGSVQVEQSEVH